MRIVCVASCLMFCLGLGTIGQAATAQAVYKVTGTTNVGSDGAVLHDATQEAFSSQVAAKLSIIKEDSPTTFRVEQTLATPPHSNTITLDSKTERLFLITAKFGKAPPPVNGRTTRPPMIPGSFSIITVLR